MKTPSTDRWKYRRTPYADHRDDGTGYYALAAAVVRQAVDDYRYADEYLKGVHVMKPTNWASRYAYNAEHTKYEVVKFFKSQWYGTICDIDPNRILRALGVKA